MKNIFSKFQLKYNLWLLIAAIFAISQSGCNSEKRVTKALIKMDQEDLNKVRPWPKNYTYYEYADMLDNAKIRYEFYKKRAIQARIANNEATAEIQKKNMEEYQKKIRNLENDRKFYKIYKLHDKELKIQIKNEQRVQNDIEKQKMKIDNTALKRQKEINKNTQKNIKEQQKRLDDKRKRLEKQQKELITDNKTTDKTLKQKNKELETIKKTAQESGNPNDPTFTEIINTLEAEINKLETERVKSKDELNTKTIELEIFIEENYAKRDTVIESQMKLSTDPIPQSTDKIIK